MRFTVLVAALLWPACSAPLVSPLEGVWQSNRELTLAEFRDAGDFTDAQWEVLSAPTFFGHMVHIYHGSFGTTVFEGECSPAELFKIVESHPDSLEIRYFDESLGEEHTITIGVQQGRMYVPITALGGGLRETFTRVSAEDVIERHPCTRAVLETMRDAAQQGVADGPATARLN